MSSRSGFEVLEPEWETAIDKKKINRTVRRERKEALAAAEASVGVVGAPTDEFDADERKKRAAASFYGSAVTKAQQRGKHGKGQSKHKGPPPDLDFEEAGWTGSLLQDTTKKAKKRLKAALPKYETAEELYDGLIDILERVPPTAGEAVSTLASLGDKLATLTKQPWNKAFKSKYGTMKKFLEARAHIFHVDGDNVSLKPQTKKAAGAKGSSSGSKQQRAGGAKGSRSPESEDEDDEDDEDEEDEDEEDESDDDEAAAQQQRQQQKRTAAAKQQQKQSGGGGSGFGVVVTILLLLVAVGGALVFTGQLQLPSAQEPAQ